MALNLQLRCFKLEHRQGQKQIPFMIPIRLIFLCGALLSTSIFGASDSLVWDEFKPRLAVDMGHLVSGRYYNNDLNMQPLNRNTVILEQHAIYGENWEFNLGFKGIMWWPFSINGNEPYQRSFRIDPRVSEAKARVNFSAQTQRAYLEFGYFPYKYNPDAQNLGEYLYRSGTYPGIVQSTDGFRLMDAAVFDAYGMHARFSHFAGIVSHDFTLFTEPSSIPIGDITPGYELSVSFPWIQLGAGAAYNRLISFDASRVRPDVDENGYFQVDSIFNVNATTKDTAAIFKGPYGNASALVKQKITAGGDSVYSVHALHHYTQRGIKLMIRGAVDMGFLLPENLRSPGDLRVFAEAALLGWENQPYFYEKRSQRMPVMAGLNLPTFRLLDRLSFQVEYYDNPFLNGKQFVETAYPIWSDAAADGEYHRDDWKWSLYARKTLNRILTIHLQAADDYLRLPLFNYNPSDMALTQNPKNWYYLMRLECRL